MIHFVNASCFKSLWIFHHISVFTLTSISLLMRKDRKSSFVSASKPSFVKGTVHSFLYWLLVETLSTAGLRSPCPSPPVPPESVQLACSEFQRTFSSFTFRPLGLQLFPPFLSFLLRQLRLAEIWATKSRRLYVIRTFSVLSI